jgi:hypothetical protein
VAHAFRQAFEDEAERREAELVLGRALLLIDQAAHGGWGVILTPGRVRVAVGHALLPLEDARQGT